jgi:hypothetical protein
VEQKHVLKINNVYCSMTAGAAWTVALQMKTVLKIMCAKMRVFAYGTATRPRNHVVKVAPVNQMAFASKSIYTVIWVEFPAPVVAGRRINETLKLATD